MPNVEETYDIVVVGAGHAGCEAMRFSAGSARENKWKRGCWSCRMWKRLMILWW